MILVWLKAPLAVWEASSEEGKSFPELQLSVNEMFEMEVQFYSAQNSNVEVAKVRMTGANPVASAERRKALVLMKKS